MLTKVLRITLLGAMTLPLVFAQTDAARITGTVTDASGAVIPAASVTVKNEKTGQERKVSTDEHGVYLAPQLQPSIYALTASAPGMATAEFKGVSLQVGQERMLNISLSPSSVTTEVNVSSGELAALDVSSARIGANVSTREVAELPMNGRQVSQLYLLAPGAVNNGSGSFDNIRFSGRSNQQNVIRYDGVEGSSIVDSSPGNLNGETTSLFRLEQSLENVQEFRVDSSNYPAEYGTGTGGQISFITKSGSNALHGSAFEYLRNDAMDARNFFDRATKSELRLNQFGGSVGGPIYKDKAFFFASFEGLRQKTSSPIVESTLSAAVRARPDCVGGATANCIAPAIRPLLGAFPVGQIASADPLLDIVNIPAPASVSENSGGIRFDYNFSPKYRFYARYFRNQGVSSQTQNSTLSLYNTTIVPQNAVASLSQLLSPTVLNETKFGFNGSKTRVAGVPGPSPDANLNGVTLNLSGSVALGGIAGQTRQRRHRHPDRPDSPQQQLQRPRRSLHQLLQLDHRQPQRDSRQAQPEIRRRTPHADAVQRSAGRHHVLVRQRGGVPGEFALVDRIQRRPQRQESVYRSVRPGSPAPESIHLLRTGRVQAAPHPDHELRTALRILPAAARRQQQGRDLRHRQGRHRGRHFRAMVQVFNEELRSAPGFQLVSGAIQEQDGIPHRRRLLLRPRAD